MDANTPPRLRQARGTDEMKLESRILILLQPIPEEGWIQPPMKPLKGSAPIVPISEYGFSRVDNMDCKVSPNL
ncbi:hypothetical protein CUMW_035660 [Citrus unshiu]|nr:hypothetical protein CUMW_035660 [Citrus unshiu]